jgi:hypothetical protein
MSFNGSGVFNINTAGQPVVSGTVITATAFNALTADLATGLSTCLTKDGQTNPTANIPMANYKFTGMGAGSDATDSANLSQVQSTVVKLIGTISGADTITGSLVPALTAYAAGQMFYFVAAGDNTGAVTLNINSLGAKNVTKNGTTALAAGEIKSGQTVAVIYDGTRFQIVNPALVSLTGYTGATNTALGVNAGDSLTSGAQNTFVGAEAGTAVTTGANSVFVGYEAGLSTTTGNFTTAVGYGASRSNVSGSSITALGYLACYNPTGSFNTALGRGAMQGGGGSTISESTAVGTYALNVVASGTMNTAVGYQAGYDQTSANWSTLIGALAGQNVTSGGANTLIGYNSGQGITTGTTNSALGDSAYLTGNYSNSSCIGYDSAVTGSSQVQLGNSSTTTYAYGAVQDRSDLRDKTDIRDTQLGLTFIMALRPRDFKWDMREDYRTKPPATPSRTAYETDEQYQVAFDQWKVDLAAWEEANKLANITHNGTHTRTRYHQGLIAQEVKQTMDALGVDFGGYQDHTIKGGDAVLTIGYEELVAPLIKAIQELKAEFDAYKATHP